MVEYKVEEGQLLFCRHITKDGNTMMLEDIVDELNAGQRYKAEVERLRNRIKMALGIEGCCADAIFDEDCGCNECRLYRILMGEG